VERSGHLRRFAVSFESLLEDLRREKRVVTFSPRLEKSRRGAGRGVRGVMRRATEAGGIKKEGQGREEGRGTIK